MDFKTITTIIFQNKQNWKTVTNEEKESLFFIFNRYMAKNWPLQAQVCNIKEIDKATAMDIWFNFLRTEHRVPNWFWRGPTKRKDPPIKDWKILQEWHNLRLADIYFMCELFPKEVKAEIARIQEIKTELEK